MYVHLHECVIYVVSLPVFLNLYMQPVKVAMVQQLYSMNTYLADVRIRVEMVNPSTNGCLSKDVDGVRCHELVA